MEKQVNLDFLYRIVLDSR